MVVGGVPTKTTDHAKNVASFALAMVRNAPNVLSPMSGQPIQVYILLKCIWLSFTNKKGL